MSYDAGFFSPDSTMWTVNRETTVLFGGARALLMHAAHPLVAAGARQTGGYRRDPWARLIRTLQLQNLVTFGSKAEATEAADRINKLHRVINGIDPVTGLRYDALDQDLLLWVHAALEASTVFFFEATVRPLSTEEKDRYHEENKLSGEILLMDRDRIPDTYSDLLEYIDAVIDGDVLRMTDVAEEVADLIRTGPVPVRIKPLWKFISFAAVGTLDPRLRRLFGFEWSDRQERFLNANLASIRQVRPFLPHRFRLILPARWAELRLATAA
jgi:uncharacterized protein (DUF2236 family)